MQVNVDSAQMKLSMRLMCGFGRGAMSGKHFRSSTLRDDTAIAGPWADEMGILADDAGLVGLLVDYHKGFGQVQWLRQAPANCADHMPGPQLWQWKWLRQADHFVAGNSREPYVLLPSQDPCQLRRTRHRGRVGFRDEDT